jgi:7,8-dihydropterin-6-yl-methyl-4-(beta-D-ribofuranosyl)aminobenzene 5'-phosphate synthase
MGAKMNKLTLILIAGSVMSAAAAGANTTGEPNDRVTLTVLYDNYKHDKSLRAEWGFSCLIETAEQTILFDTGGDADVLASNFEKLGADPNKIDTVVISHMHWDHINGLDWLIKENNHLKIYLPNSATAEKVKELQSKAESVTLVSEMKYIDECVFSTGTLQQNVPEQALCIETADGLVVITGCSHPGIVRILKKAKELSKKEICFAFGGFHLKGHNTEQIKEIIEEIKSLGVKRIGPTHCTGDKAIELFKQAWGYNYVSMGVGKQFSIRLRKNCTE